MAKKKAGLALPKPPRVYIVIDSPLDHRDGPPPKDYYLTKVEKDKNGKEVTVDIGALAQASVKAGGGRLIKVKTVRVRRLIQSDRRGPNTRRTDSWTFRRTFIFER